MAGGTRKGKNGKVGIRLWGLPALVCLTFGLGACMSGQSASPRQDAAPVVPADQAAPDLPVFMEAPIGAPVTAPPLAPVAGTPSPSGARVVYVPVVVSNPAARADVAPAASAGQAGASSSAPALPRAREIYAQEGQAAPAGAASPAAGVAAQNPVPTWNPQGQPSAEGARALAAAPRQDPRAAQTPPPQKTMPEGPVTTVSVPVSRTVAQAAPATPPAPVQTPPAPPAPPTVPAWDPHAQPVVSTPAAVPPAPAGATSPTAAPGKQARASAPAAAPARPTDQTAYKAALASYQAKRFEDSERAFDAFLRDYPNSKLTPNALYWKGESLYSRRLYPEAIFVFKDVTARYPKHQKASDALLKAGMAYGRMNDEDNARLHYQVLVEDYPSSPAARRAKELKLLK